MAEKWANPILNAGFPKGVIQSRDELWRTRPIQSYDCVQETSGHRWFIPCYSSMMFHDFLRLSTILKWSRDFVTVRIPFPNISPNEQGWGIPTVNTQKLSMVKISESWLFMWKRIAEFLQEPHSFLSIAPIEERRHRVDGIDPSICRFITAAPKPQSRVSNACRVFCFLVSIWFIVILWFYIYRQYTFVYMYTCKHMKIYVYMFNLWFLYGSYIFLRVSNG